MHRALESAYFVVARTGSRAAVLRRSEATCFSSSSDVAFRASRSSSIKRKNASAPSSSARRARDSRRSQLAETDGAHFERSLPCPTSKVAR